MLVQSTSHDRNLMHGMKKFVSNARLRKDHSSESGKEPIANISTIKLNSPVQVQEPLQISGDASATDKNQSWPHFKRGLSLRPQFSNTLPSDDGQAAAGVPVPPKPRKKVPHGMYGWKYEDEEEVKPKPAVVPPSPALIDSSANSRPASVSLARAASVSTAHSSEKANSIHSPKQRKKVPHGLYGFRYEDEPKSNDLASPSSPVSANGMAKSKSKDDQSSNKSPRGSIVSASGQAEVPSSPNIPKRKKVPFGMYGWRYEDELDTREKPSGPQKSRVRNSFFSSKSVDPPEISELPAESHAQQLQQALQPWTAVSKMEHPVELPSNSPVISELPAGPPPQNEPVSNQGMPFLNMSIRDIDWSKVPEEHIPILLQYYNKSGKSDSGIAFPEENGPAYVGKGKGRAIEADAPAGPSLSNEILRASNTNGIDHIKLPLEIPENDKGKSFLGSTCEEYFKQAADFEMKQAAKRQAREEAQARIDKEDRERRWQIELDLAREAELQARRKECPVCGEPKDPLDYPTRPATRKCKHTCSICTECVHAWLASELESKGCDNLKCPECPQPLSYADVQSTASAITFSAYDALCARNALNASDEFAWCLAPGCASGQINIDNNSFMDCATCGYKQCLTHQVPWHVGETCAQYEYRTSGAQAREEERASEATLKDISKRCPGENCGWRIQKLDGCDHMTCRRCRHEFCWLCLAAQKEIRRVGNTAHKEDCKYHSDNLDIAWPFNAH